MAQLCRDGLDEKLRSLARQELDDIDRKTARRDRMRAAARPRPIEQTPVAAPVAAVDDVEAIFEQFARAWVEADRAGDKSAARRLKAECRAMLVRKFPLTSPSAEGDPEFERRFQAAVIRAVEESHAATGRDDDESDDDVIAIGGR